MDVTAEPYLAVNSMQSPPVHFLIAFLHTSVGPVGAENHDVHLRGVGWERNELSDAFQIATRQKRPVDRKDRNSVQRKQSFEGKIDTRRGTRVAYVVFSLVSPR